MLWNKRPPHGGGASFNHNNNVSGRVLQDKTENGRERPWREHKRQAEALAAAYEKLGFGFEGKADRVRYCGSWLEFSACPEGHEKRLKSAFFCKVRLCPMCQWRRSLKIFAQLTKVLHEVGERQPLRYVFLTLTTRNVSGDDLPGKLDDLFGAWKRLAEVKAFKAAAVGWFRALEVTRNDRRFSGWYGTYHPHFHCLLAVKPSYFKGTGYIKQKEWRDMWREALRADYDPIVDVRTVKARRTGQTEETAALEAGKYAVKATDYILGDEVETLAAVETFDRALRYRRLVAYGGLLAKVRRELGLTDVESKKADLIHIDEEEKETCTCSVCMSVMIPEVYGWHIGMRDYVLAQQAAAAVGWE